MLPLWQAEKILRVGGLDAALMDEAKQVIEDAQVEVEYSADDGEVIEEPVVKPPEAPPEAPEDDDDHRLPLVP